MLLPLGLSSSVEDRGATCAFACRMWLVECVCVFVWLGLSSSIVL